MKNFKIAGTYLFCIMFISLGCLFTSCRDDIDTGKDDEGRLVPNEEVTPYVVNENGKQNAGLTEFRNEGKTDLRVRLNHPALEDITAKLVYEEDVLVQYNLKNKTNYELFPQAKLEIKADGGVQIAKDSKESNAVELIVKTDTAFNSNKSYVIPLTLTIETGANNISNEEAHYLVFVKDLTTVPSAEKYAKGADGVLRRVEIISCMEMGDTNPLNNLNFTLESSGKPLVDYLVMFSGNIKYNEVEGKVYLSLNNPIQHVLDNNHEFLKPLKERGIKIVMGVMPHHDRASLTNLSDETARLFVQELKSYIDAYDLDGVFWDEEYASKIYPPPPGFVSGSNQEFLFHEFNRVMPDKVSMVYAYSSLYSVGKYNGKPSGEYVTHALNDYPNTSGMDGRFPGLPKSGWGVYSREFAKGQTYQTRHLQDIKDKGYCTMIFAMDPYRSTYGSQVSAMRSLAEQVFDDKLVIDENFHKKDY